MVEFFLSFEYLISLVIDVLVLYFVAGALNVRENNIGKAVILTLIAAILGYLLGPVLLATLFVSLSTFFLAMIMVLFFRLILIKIIYKTNLGKAFSIWIVSAIVSIIVSFFLPFY